MREMIARTVSALVVGTLVALAAVFAGRQNTAHPDASAPVAAAAPLAPTAEPAARREPPADSARGHAVFLAQGCARCHSVAGAGSGRAPLDGVGARRTPAALRAWSTGSAALADSLAPSALRAKQPYAKLPPADLDALVAFLASLKSGR